MNKNYDEDFYKEEKEYSKNSSGILLPYILKQLKCKTVVDFGCGVGECLNVVKQCAGIEKVMGLDGEWVREYLEIEQEEFYGCDLTHEIYLEEKYDLAISLEVAEHLPKENAKTFINNLIRHADIVLFSAAIPYQGGTYHINEQYPSYWRKIFSELGFAMCDCIRSRFWNDERINDYYRQNTFIYCKSKLQHEILETFQCKENIIDVIHPHYWKTRNSYSYIFPFERVEHNAKIIIYGAGRVGKVFVNQLISTTYAKIVLWCDRAFKDYENYISDPQKINEILFDNIVIAIEKKKTALEVIEYLTEIGVPEEKIVWRSPLFKNQY